MKENIAKWYRSAGIAPIGDFVEKRNEGINYYVDEVIDRKTILELIRLFFGYDCEEEVLEKFVDAFYQYDDTFADDQINEIRVLAGIVLYKLVIENGCEDSIAIEICMHGYVFLGIEPVVKEICDTILNDYIEKTSEIREDLSFEPKKVVGLSKEVKFSVEEDETENFDVGVTKNLDSLVKKVKELVTNINTLYKECSQRDKVLYEESQILWWLISEYSDDEGKQYCELDMCQAAILAGKDLASKILLLPGPYAAKSVLNKVLATFHEKDTIDLQEYINACNDIVIKQLLEGHEITTPILFALQAKLKCGEAGWKKSFENNFSNIGKKYSALEIAYQMYLECLLLKCNK